MQLHFQKDLVYLDVMKQTNVIFHLMSQSQQVKKSLGQMMIQQLTQLQAEHHQMVLMETLIVACLWQEEHSL